MDWRRDDIRQVPDPNTLTASGPSAARDSPGLRATPERGGRTGGCPSSTAEDHWAIVDLVGKARHIRTVPVADWVKNAIDSWLVWAGVSEGRVFRCVCRAGKTWGNGVTERVVWHVVKECATKAAIENLARMTSDGPVHACAAAPEGSWTRSNFY